MCPCQGPASPICSPGYVATTAADHNRHKPTDRRHDDGRDDGHDGPPPAPYRANIRGNTPPAAATGMMLALISKTIHRLAGQRDADRSRDRERR